MEAKRKLSGQEGFLPVESNNARESEQYKIIVITNHYLKIYFDRRNSERNRNSKMQ